MTQTTENSHSQVTDLISAERRMKSIHCLMLPLQQETMLLPNAAVAEVINFSIPEPIEDAPSWLLGQILWRDRIVPLISFESASGIRISDAENISRIAILNTLNNNARVPYIAVALQGIPRLRQVQQETLSSEEVDVGRTSIAAQMVVDGIPVVVPDIDALESRLQQLS